MHKEQLVVVKRKQINSYLPPKRPCLLMGNMAMSILTQCSQHYNIESRTSELEKDASTKQIIPYVVITSDQFPLPGTSVFTVSRTAKQSEKRLHNKLSIGIGGHMNEQDIEEAKDTNNSQFYKGLFHSAIRELNEEVFLSKDYKGPFFLGVINDDTDEVGKVHLGMVFHVFAGSDVAINETSKMTGQYMEFPLLLEKTEVGHVENWSKILIEDKRMRSRLGGK